jgi:hypothetical protein
MTTIKEASLRSGIPEEELQKLMAMRYKKDTVLIRPIAIKNIGFAKQVISRISKELEVDLKQSRRDVQNAVNHAFRLIMCNMVNCVFERKPLAIAGSNKDYNKGTILNKLFLTKTAVDRVTEALEQHKYIKKKKGNKLSERVNSYQPTKKLEIEVIPLIYETYEEYNEQEMMVVFSEPKKKKSTKKEAMLNKGSSPSGYQNLVTTGLFSSSVEHTMRRSSKPLPLTTDHPDLLGLKRINEALKDCTYALKSPVRRIYSHNDPMQGGRLYTRIQGLPDRRARIRINTLFNGEPVAEVDLSSNHPRMLMALEGKKLAKNFYDDVAEATKTTRDQVKFLLTRAIGASNRAISLKPKIDEKDWFKTDFIITPKQRQKVDAYLAEKHPLLFKHLYKGMGVHLQALEGTILMDTMLELLDMGIPSLPIHDAVYVQRKFAKQAQNALEKVWMEVLQVDFKPYTKIDTADK